MDWTLIAKLALAVACILVPTLLAYLFLTWRMKRNVEARTREWKREALRARLDVGAPPLSPSTMRTLEARSKPVVLPAEPTLPPVVRTLEMRTFPQATSWRDINRRLDDDFPRQREAEINLGAMFAALQGSPTVAPVIAAASWDDDKPACTAAPAPSVSCETSGSTTNEP
jgi:hypothetical protein